MNINNVGILGCGTMGSGIVHAVLKAGYQVAVLEMNQRFLDMGLANIEKALSRDVEKGVISQEEKESIRSRIKGTIRIEDLRSCDLIIEAVFEDFDVKAKIFKELDELCPPKTIFCSNTSSLSISELAVVTNRKECFFGLHFFNPVAVMKLVEVVYTLASDKEIMNRLIGFVKTLQKVPIVAKDYTGFIVNLLITPYLFDAICVLSEGLGSVEDIDNGMKLGSGHPMGPLALADFIGLDLLYKSGNKLFAEYKEKRYAPPPLLEKMVTMGFLGKKSGRGFYDWSDPKNPIPQSIF
jgi:3-hydroxybutyryl-CoA dehydrogenase